MEYFTSSMGGPDSLSLQEMLDMDIKSENDYENVFNCGDLNLNFHELPALNLDEDSLGAPGDNNVWLASDGNSLLDGDVSNSFSQDLNSGETRMVSPNSVMPVTLIQVPYDRSGGRSAETSLLKPIKVNNSTQRTTIMTPEVKREIKEEVDDHYVRDMEIKHEYESDEDESFDEAYVRALSYKNNQNSRSKSRINGNTLRVTNGTKRSVTLKSLSSKRRLQESSGSDSDATTAHYPKPAYSYSCLITMALKNSPSGSLPVSEIYNFMCEHFPYFKTAPNGWKNSVRHNLSLNKCFEKIEKPATNGSQRKGCLWAMNPNKMHKMDEEVQKWSKKDKTAIRRSMICPDTLDALERGELSTGGRIAMSEMESDEEAWDQEANGEDDEEEEEDKEWASDRLMDALPGTDLEDSDISLTDFDIEVAESLCKEAEAGKLNVRVNVQTSPNGAFQPLMSGTYTVSSQGIADNSPKRIKTIGGTTMTGNFVYKPVGTSSMTKTKSPLRQSLLSSLEADD